LEYTAATITPAAPIAISARSAPFRIVTFFCAAIQPYTFAIKRRLVGWIVAETHFPGNSGRLLLPLVAKENTNYRNFDVNVKASLITFGITPFG